jgi:hypothetical protein
MNKAREIGHVPATDAKPARLIEIGGRRQSSAYPSGYIDYNDEAMGTAGPSSNALSRRASSRSTSRSKPYEVHERSGEFVNHPSANIRRVQSDHENETFAHVDMYRRASAPTSTYPYDASGGCFQYPQFDQNGGHMVSQANNHYSSHQSIQAQQPIPYNGQEYSQHPSQSKFGQYDPSSGYPSQNMYQAPTWSIGPNSLPVQAPPMEWQGQGMEATGWAAMSRSASNYSNASSAIVRDPNNETDGVGDIYNLPHLGGLVDNAMVSSSSVNALSAEINPQLSSYTQTQPLYHDDNSTSDRATQQDSVLFASDYTMEVGNLQREADNTEEEMNILLLQRSLGQGDWEEGMATFAGGH